MLLRLFIQEVCIKDEYKNRDGTLTFRNECILFDVYIIGVQIFKQNTNEINEDLRAPPPHTHYCIQTSR